MTKKKLRKLIRAKSFRLVPMKSKLILLLKSRLKLIEPLNTTRYLNNKMTGLRYYELSHHLISPVTMNNMSILLDSSGCYRDSFHLFHWKKRGGIERIRKRVELLKGLKWEWDIIFFKLTVKVVMNLPI